MNTHRSSDTSSSFRLLLSLNDTLCNRFLFQIILSDSFGFFRASWTAHSTVAVPHPNHLSSSMALLAATEGKTAEANSVGSPKAWSHIPNGVLRPPGNTFAYWELLLIPPTFLNASWGCWLHNIVTQVKAKVCWPFWTSFRALLSHHTAGSIFPTSTVSSLPLSKSPEHFLSRHKKALPKAKTCK